MTCCATINYSGSQNFGRRVEERSMNAVTIIYQMSHLLKDCLSSYDLARSIMVICFPDLIAELYYKGRPGSHLHFYHFD